jgi:hypothetical protein
MISVSSGEAALKGIIVHRAPAFWTGFAPRLAIASLFRPRIQIMYADEYVRVFSTGDARMQGQLGFRLGHDARPGSAFCFRPNGAADNSPAREGWVGDAS